MKKKILKATVPTFSGFTPETMAFLHRLAQNNNRDWFNANKVEFERVAVTPALDLIEAIAAPLAKISPHFLCIPKRVGGSLFRIQRDTRFAHDKRPYKTNLGLHFRHEAEFDVHAPGYYLHIGIDECFIACGVWHPERPALNRIRQAIVEEPAKWASIRRALQRDGRFAFWGESLKRLPTDIPVPADHPWTEDIRRKDFILLQPIEEGVLYSPDLLDFLCESYAAATPLMRFLCRTQGAHF